ncbi:type VI secretion system tip protein VgrG [Roseomonas hellenica]|uniref:Type VI secretion system tip protein VgrG n=1 Tax=Plastoroseomonas hellenica TaxID=2687306 RepID=A0ABS5F495_9PROT|nr:type VI secretion system tip protein TssI/VgrG [Plastoroseomonas hellenica]MBR0667384.1 type VI secretion system tip protein VgrG [Plastoroseomonas hellenica]
MNAYDQSERLLRIDTPLGDSKALLIELDGEDAISRPFLFRIAFATREPEAKVRKLLGKPVTLWVGANSEPGHRPVHGHVRRLTRRHSGRLDTHLWQAEVVPALWFLSQKADCRIFQSMTVPQVLDKVFQIHGLTAVEQRGLTGSYPKLDYCVQYRETALDFVSRLMEEVGLFYWHEHKDGQHTLVIADQNQRAPKLVPETITYGGLSTEEKLTWFEQDLEFRTGTWAMRDYNFETPTTNMGANKPTHLDVSRMKDHEVFDYPGRYTNPGEGGTVTRLRIEQEEARHRIMRGGGDTKTMTAGYRVTIDDQDGVGAELCLITEVRHTARDTSFWASDEDAEGSRYGNEFAAIPASVPYRPARTTPRPFVRGTQTATVTGPAGSEIHTDKYGRVKLRFHWDRNPDGTADEQSSCWVRVSQIWAGANWGAMHIPRVGHEVVVDFLEGDPDRPLITGRVYNADNMPPWALPGNKTQSGIKSNSSLGGGGSNEFRFEDKKGSEQIYLHAQKDLDSIVENNETRHVKKNRTTTIDGNETLFVNGALRKTVVDADFDETVTGTEKRTITGPITENVTNTYTMNVTAGALNITTLSGVNISSPAAINITSGTAVNIVAPTKTAVAPSWFKSGSHAGDAYGFKLGIAGMKLDLTGLAMAFIGVKADFVGVKLDNFIVAVKTGAFEYKNKALKAKTYAFSLSTGFTIVT